jgi:hypothetical protein
MKGVAEVHQICQSGKGLCFIVIFLMLLLPTPTRPTVAHSVRSSGDPAPAGTQVLTFQRMQAEKNPR